MSIKKYDDVVLYCGVEGHDLDCLCDVYVTEITPVMYGTDDHWVLSMIAKYFEIDFVESRESLGFLLEKSEEFLTVHLEKRDVSPPSVLYKKTREKAEEIVAVRQGKLMPSELQDILGLHGDKFLEYMTYGKPRAMTIEKMDKIVTMRRSGMSHYKMCNILGIINKNKQMGLAGWLSRIFVDPYMEVKK